MQENVRYVALAAALGLALVHVYLVALFGLGAFYGLDRMALLSRRGADTGDRTARACSASTSPRSPSTTR